MSNEANLGNLWDDLGWNVVYTHDVEPRQQQVFDVDELDLSDANKRFLREKFNGKIYGHQKETIRLAMTGQNVCMTTGTASGKSLPFYVTAIEHLVRNPLAKVIAIYPLKALGREQEDRWKQTLLSAGLDKQIRVGRIDGSVKGKDARIKILKESRVLILTPDIIHHWLLLSPGQKDVKHLLKNLSLFIVDEVHTYTGVFGSNSAFLFRRIQHLMSILGASPKYVCASATIANPFEHLQKLFGLDFALVGSEFDTSPKNKVKTWLVNPPVVQDLLSNITELIDYLVQNTPSRIITFVDSRKMAEYVTTLLERIQNNDDTDDADSSEGETHGNLFANPLEHLNILPYRSGYEEQDAKVIQNRLSQGLARGVISTSALELGLDIPSLDVCILVGVPQSSTSFFQRIGRVGRHSEGNIIVINTGSISDEAIFSHPENLLKRPMAEGALYLENIRIQYIHALCLARQNGEHDQVFGKQGDIAFSSTVNWADGFVELCCKERLGEISADLQSMKLEAGDTPNHIFPLRDVESQFKITLKQGPDERDLGSVSYGQLMREAYPGAVY